LGKKEEEGSKKRGFLWTTACEVHFLSESADRRSSATVNKRIKKELRKEKQERIPPPELFENRKKGYTTPLRKKKKEGNSTLKNVKEGTKSGDNRGKEKGAGRYEERTTQISSP